MLDVNEMLLRRYEEEVVRHEKMLERASMFFSEETEHLLSDVYKTLAKIRTIQKYYEDSYSVDLEEEYTTMIEGII